MMLKNFFLLDVMLLASFGLLLDAVFIPKEKRKKLSAYLESRTGNLSINQRFSTFLDQVYSIIFGRFFHAKFISLRFVISAFFVSLISFSIVIAIQIYLFPEAYLGKLKLDLKQFWLLAVFIFFNFCFNYFTIIQSKIFIEAARDAKDLFSSVLFIVSDLIVTVNTFILSYAFFILIVILCFIWRPQNVEFIVEGGQLSARTVNSSSGLSGARELKSLQLGSKLERESKYEGVFRAILLPNNSRQDAEHIAIYYHSSFDTLDPKDNAFIVEQYGRLNLERNEITMEHDSKKMMELKRIWNEMFPHGPLRKSDSIATFSADVKIERSRNINSMYIVSFYTVNRLENDFLGFLEGQMGLLELSDFIVWVISPEFMDSFKGLKILETGFGSNPIIFCFDNNLQKRVNFSDRCEKFIYVQNVTRSNKNISLIGRNLDDYFFPFNTLFITSILPTVVIYFSIVLLAISLLLFSRPIIWIYRVKTLLLRAPMAMSSLLLAVVLLLMRLI